MRLFHVSEESNIEIFEPRIPYRDDIDKTKGLVWAINEKCIPNFLTPRNCPRVTYYSTDKSSEEDKLKFFSSKSSHHVVAMEQKWFKIMGNTTLYIYEFDSSKFYIQDETAGYYVSEVSQVPINKFTVTDLFQEHFKRNIEIRIVDNLWDLCGEIKKTTLNWSMCRMGYAQERGCGMFRLGIIEESLVDKNTLEVLKPYFYSQRIENVPEDEFPIWHTNEYHVPEEKIKELLQLLEMQVKQTWYMHTFNDKMLIVVLPGKSFEISRERNESWNDMIEYGVKIAKVERHFLENIPLHI